MEDWNQQRARAIAAHAAELAKREAVDTAAAEEMLREFVASAASRGIPTVALRARSPDGRHRYRTGLRGWYLLPDGRIAVGEDGRFYLLSVPASMAGLVRGVTVPPARARTVIGDGGRDGDRVALRTLLDRCLDA